MSPTAAELGGTGQIRNAYFGKHIDRNVKITQFEKNNSTSGTTVGFNWATSDNIDALHLYDGDTKLKEFSVSGKSGSITYTVTPNRNYRFQIRVKKTGTSLWTNSGYIEHSIGYPSITGDFNLNINSPINLYFTGTTPTSSVYLYVGSKDDDNYFAEKKNIQSSYVSITLTSDQKNKIYKLAGLKEWITVVIVQNLHINGIETPYQQYSATMQLNISSTAPVFTNYSYSNINYSVSNIIGSSKALANIPCMQVQISTSNKAHSSVSTISKYVCTISGGNNNSFSRTYEAQESQSDVLIDLGAITEYGRYSISVYAVDARGISSSPVVKQNAFEVIDYHVPLATTFELKRLGNFEKEVSLNVVCNISRVSGYNTSFTSYYRYCRTGTSMPLSWTTITNIQDGGIDGSDYKKIIINSNFLTLEKGESYDFQFKFKDRFSEVVINPSLSQGVAPLSVYEDGTVAINRVPDFNQTDRAKLQIDGDIMINRNSDSEEVKINKITAALNKIKIKYVNAANVLSYEYDKYKIKSSYELGRKFELYLQMKEERKHVLMMTANLNDAENKLLMLLKRIGISDTVVWLSQTKGLYIRNEMVEIRHELAARRKKLRNQIEYNEGRIEEAKYNIRKVNKLHPEYTKETLEILDEYEKRSIN